MKDIRFLDLADVNCWIVYNMPFVEDERSDYELVNGLQNSCIKNKIFGMGWEVKIPGFDSNTKMTKENKDRYVEVYNKTGSVSLNAVNSYSKIKNGDYVITRNKDGQYYVGKVSSDGAFYLYDENDADRRLFSWGCMVEEWKPCGAEMNIPSEIAGRFSQRYHSTIQKIAKYRQKLLVMAMYGDLNIPKLGITRNNFVNSLNYMELEDLVSVFMSQRHRGYYLLPSTCKISQQNIEFCLKSGETGNLVTCQVKNKKKITIDHYIDKKVYDSYETIYLFSGEWDNKTIDELREKYKDYPRLYIIKPDELYDVLKNVKIFSNPFYVFDKEVIETKNINLDGYRKISEDERLNGEMDYSIDDDYICFVKKDGLFYSREFGALVLSYHIDKDHAKEKEWIDRILKDINR